MSSTERESRPAGAPTRRRTALLATFTILIGLIGALLFLELVLRLLPVTQALERQPVDGNSPYLHYRTNTQVRVSKGWNFSIVNRVRINNSGFVNDQDYDPAAASPLLAVIGDSYVEAVQVRYRETIHGRLAELVGARGRVYSFGVSGSPLSQYLAYARYASERFQPNALVVVVVANDFDESFYENRPYPGYHYLKSTGKGSYELELVPFSPSFFYRVARSSALAQYVFNNNDVPATLDRIRRFIGDKRRSLFASGSAEPSDPDLEQSMKASDYFLQALPSSAGLRPESIVLVIDGQRKDLYEPMALNKAETSYDARMRRHFITRAREGGYHVIDLQPRFVARHVRDGTRFESDVDFHWNAAGHEEAALGVLDTGVPQRLFGPLFRTAER